MNPLNKQMITVTITNNATAPAESITMNIGVHQGAFDEMMHNLRDDLERYIQPCQPHRHRANDPQTSDT